MKLEILLVALHGACDYLQREQPDFESYNERLGLPEPLTAWEMRKAHVLANALSRFAVAAMATTKKPLPYKNRDGEVSS
jgi:hypothetical protein